jgi:imidazolonepropionase-like amidohydrolase
MALTAFTNGRLIDGNGGAPVDGATVLVDGTLIRAAGARDVVAVPDGAAVIDVRGRTIMPGMMDLHVHLGGGAYRPVALLAKFLAAGFTTIGHVAGNQPHVTVPLRQAIEDGTLPWCARLIAGAVVTGTNGHVKGRTADGPWEVRKAVREMVEQKADFIKTAATGGFASPDEETWWVDYTYEELEALVDEAHSVGRLVVVHAHSQPGLNNAIRAGCDQIHHGALIDEEALQGIKEKGLFFVPTLRVTSQRNIEVKAAAGRPWESRKMRETSAVHRAGVRRAHELGITMGLGTDLPSTAPWDAGDSAVEIKELVACGLTPLEALGVATKGSARCMRLEDRLGTLEAGKTADVVVVDGDPSRDAGVLLDVENVRQVMKDGRLVVDRDRGFFGPVPQHRGAGR